MDFITPDLKWYTTISSERGVQPRCPFATIEKCPRHYQSLSLLGKTGVSTSIQQDEDERLEKYWKSTDIWPKTAEQETYISGTDGKKSDFCNFCPEVSFDRFGYFASYLGRYATELDSGNAVKFYTSQGAPSGHWCWTWAGVTELHYTDCPLYSILMHRDKKGISESSSNKKQSKCTEFYHNHPFIFWLIATVISAIISIVGIIVAL